MWLQHKYPLGGFNIITFPPETFRIMNLLNLFFSNIHWVTFSTENLWKHGIQCEKVDHQFAYPKRRLLRRFLVVNLIIFAAGLTFGGSQLSASPDHQKYTLPKTNILLMEEILHQLRLIVYPIIYRVLYISGGAGFLPSTVSTFKKWWETTFLFGLHTVESIRFPFPGGICEGWRVFVVHRWPSLDSGTWRPCAFFSTQRPNWNDGTKLARKQRHARWWFQFFLLFTPTWGRFPFWLIFFKGVETTN